MRKTIVQAGTLVAGLLLTAVVYAEPKGKPDAKSAFDKHCVSCHPDGGNVINQAKPIKKADLQKAGIKTWKDIVAKMRNPGPGMKTFSKKDISDKDARAIAEYILKTFK